MLHRITLLAGLGALVLTGSAAAQDAAQRSPWGSTALETPYREDISAAEKVAGLAKVWSEVKFNFANFDQVPELDWDSLFLAFIPQVESTTSTLEYYRTLQRFTAPLEDGHTRVQLPPELADLERGRAPIHTRLTEGRVIVHRVYTDSLPEVAALGIEPGMEVVAVDGVPVKEYVAEHIAPFRGNNTPQGRDRTLYDYALLRGPVGTPVILTLRDRDGAERSVSLPRLRRIPGSWSLVEFEKLEEGIGYLTIRSFAWDQVLAEVDSLFPLIQETDALIIDLRGNGGGNGRIGWPILGYLTDDTLTYQQWFSREYRPIWRAWGEEQQLFLNPPGTWPADSERFYAKPVAVLIRSRTASMAENFCVGFRIMNRGLIIGEATAGSSGTPLFFALPGGGRGQVVTTRGQYPGGEEYIGVGVVPDIEVLPTVEDVWNGRDPVLERATEELRRLTIGAGT
jgi:C-terminal processing protease CtpA/Prc